MAIEDGLRQYVTHVKEGGDPTGFDRSISTEDREIWASWRTDEPDNTTRIEISVNGERFGYFVNGERTPPSWEGGVDVPEVSEWEGVCRL